MSTIQPYIISEAARWLSLRCQEETQNRGVCVDEIHRQFGQVSDAAWCARFVYVVVKNAFVNAGLDSKQNRLPQESSTLSMLALSKQRGLRVGRLPELGSVFIRAWRDKPGQGHAGIVVGQDKTEFVTIEGNASNRILIRRYRYDEAWKAGFEYINIQDAIAKTPWTGGTINLRPSADAGAWWDFTNIGTWMQENPATAAVLAAIAGSLVYYLTKKS